MEVQEHDENAEEFNVVLLEKGKLGHPKKDFKHRVVHLVTTDPLQEHAPEFQTRTVEVQLGLERTESTDGYYHRYIGENLFEIAKMLDVELSEQLVFFNVYNVREAFDLSILSDTVGLLGINSTELLASKRQSVSLSRISCQSAGLHNACASHRRNSVSRTLEKRLRTSANESSTYFRCYNLFN